ncbi:MAG: hypothetical protein M0D55_06485 [Elusimicrobiota bacterium]|nr:MAG: hypothetical protein M0D55_06485 [Elusimicrobiota bacterium]
MKPLLSLLALSLASGLRAAPDVAPKPPPKPPSEALLAAACSSKGGLLVLASGQPAADGTKDEPEDLFGAPDPEPGTAGPADKPAGKPATGEPGAGAPAASDDKKPKPKVLHLKARGKDKKASRKKCREEFKGYYARNGDLKVAVAPDVEGRSARPTASAWRPCSRARRRCCL